MDVVASQDVELEDVAVKKVPDFVVLDVAVPIAKTHKILYTKKKMNWSELKGNFLMCVYNIIILL